MAPSGTRAQVSHFVVRKALGIDINERYATQPDNLDSRAREILDPADIYLEDEPTVADFFRDLQPSRAGAVHYVQSLFPAAAWIGRYNVRWLMGDVIAGREFHQLLTSGILTRCRHHYWFSRGSSSYGLCPSCPTAPCVRLIHLLHRCRLVLVIRYFQGHCHRCKS